MADPIVINASDVTTIASGANSGLDVTLQGINIAWQGAYYNPDASGSVDFRVYANKSMTLTAESNISKVEIAGYCKAGLAVTANAGTITTGASYASETTKGTLEDPLIVVDEIGATSVTLTCTKQMRAYTIRVTLGEGGDVEPTEVFYLTGSIRNWARTADDDYKFTVNPANPSEYMLQGITLDANDALKVIGLVGETLNWYPAGQDNNYVVAADGTYNIYFRPDGQGGQDWHYGYFYVAEVVPATAISCADVYNMAKNDVVDLLNDVVVTYVNGANVYVKDATASMLIYLPKNTTVDWVAGNVLSGVAGVVDVYNGLYEVKPSADQIAAVTATAGEAPAAEELTAITAADVNKYASISNVTVAAGEFVTTSATNLDMVLNGTTYVLRNYFKIAYTFEAGREYNMVGVVSIYTKNDATTLQFFPITIEKIIGAAIENTNVEAETVKFFENGQLFINKNGVIYNAQGTIVR